MSDRKPTIGITWGDPAGIGPEVIQKALADPALPAQFAFEIVGREAAERWAQLPGESIGRSTDQSARVALDALNEAVASWKAGRFAAIVTGPVQKETIAKLQPGFIGQTEFFAAACGIAADDVVMTMADPKMTVALVTGHCSLKRALEQITPTRIARVAHELNRFLQLTTGRDRPRLALAGLNPHAGEHGMFGNEEVTLLKPVAEQLRAEGLDLSDPQPPDTVFYHALSGKFDGVVCLYHDQGLIPFKLVAFSSGVNVTLGLPLIRTSPDHGTALDIAGKGLADHRSMLAAIQLACRLAQDTV